RDNLDITEQDYYTSLYSESQAQFNTHVKAGIVMNNYAHMLIIKLFICDEKQRKECAHVPYVHIEIANLLASYMIHLVETAELL
nr:DNA repair protein RAD16 isoform X1 [Tanacetum cinerariifolium]